MVSSSAWRDAADHLAGGYQVSVRRACGALGLHRSVYYYNESKREDGPLREAIRALAQQRRRWGYRRILLKLRQRGWKDNHKRIARIYREEKLQVRRRNRKRVSRGEREPLMQPAGPNQLWAMDFLNDMAGGRKMKLLAVIDISDPSSVWRAIVLRADRVVSLDRPAPEDFPRSRTLAHGGALFVTQRQLRRNDNLMNRVYRVAVDGRREGTVGVG